MRITILHLQHVAELVMTVIETKFLPESKEIAFLNADTEYHVLIRPFATRKTKAHGNRQSPVIARLDIHNILAVFVRHRNIRIRKEFLVAQETFRFQKQVQVDHVALVKKQKLADSRLARLDMHPV